MWDFTEKTCLRVATGKLNSEIVLVMIKHEISFAGLEASSLPEYFLAKARYNIS